ncbi:hypothetical protein DBR45_13555, partial [Pseudomonas sp. HMWF031]
LNLHGMNRIHFITDYWMTDLTRKKITLDDIREKWQLQKKEDNQFKWFKDDNHKSALAWEWLSKNTSLLGGYNHCFEDFEDFLIFFDNINLIPEQKEFYIEKIKKRWSQQKYREKLTGKAQYNFILSDKAAAILDSLSTRYEISRARVIELLLEMEEIKNDHIPERTKITNSLNTD